jgi:hypothetical protein
MADSGESYNIREHEDLAMKMTTAAATVVLG